MIFYFSGAAKGRPLDAMLRHRVAKLSSFAYPREITDYLEAADAAGVRVRAMIDSGAFTVWNAGGQVSRDALCQHIVRIHERFGARHEIVAIALDKIPGARGRAPTPDEIAAAVEESIANYDFMRAAMPVPILPVYHTGEDRAVLERYMRTADWVAFGMSQDWSGKERLRWAAGAIPAGVRVHGLAATSTAMMEQVPWYSVDSATWAMAAAMGHLVINTARGLRQITISAEAPRLKDEGAHIFNMAERPRIEAMIRARGYDPDVLAVDSVERQAWNIETFATYQPRRVALAAPVGLF